MTSAGRGCVVHHLSHGDVSEWVEKTNRYTSMPDRLRVDRTCDDLIQFARERIDFWGRQTRDPTPGDYPMRSHCCARPTT